MEHLDLLFGSMREFFEKLFGGVGMRIHFEPSIISFTCLRLTASSSSVPAPRFLIWRPLISLDLERSRSNRFRISLRTIWTSFKSLTVLIFTLEVKRLRVDLAAGAIRPLQNKREFRRNQSRKHLQ